MCKYILTKKAVNDLTGIWNYTFDTWSENQADKYYEQLLSFSDLLSKNPNRGKSYNYLIIGLKGSQINKHIVFYRTIADNVIEIERILHERMDLKTRLEK